MRQLSLGLAIAVSAATAAVWVVKKKARKRSLSYYEQLPVFKLTNSKGMEVHITPVGASIVKLIVPDKRGQKADVVLGYDKIEEYMSAEPTYYLGAIVGRVANRIANAKFTLNDKEHHLAANNGPNALHGGVLGFHRRVWSGEMAQSDTHSSVTLQYDSAPGEEGYPGGLHVVVTYKLESSSNQLTCTIKATATDEATPVSITQHSYFNLAGHNSGQTILDHIVRIPSGDHYTPVNEQLIPTGRIEPVQGTPLDFSRERAIKERIAELPTGYDHNYVLFNQGPQAKFITKNGTASVKPKLAATLHDPKSGRTMEMLTTAPAMQFYSGNFLNDSIVGKGGARYGKHAGLCMEAQGFPDAVNQPSFPSVILNPQETYTNQIVYIFGNA